MCNLLLLYYKVFCMFSFLSSKPKILQLTDVFQGVASRIPNLVIFLSPIPFGDGVFIGIPALISMVYLHLARVRGLFFKNSCVVADSHSSLMEWDRQFNVSIISHYICEHISCNSVGSLTSCSSWLDTHSQFSVFMASRRVSSRVSHLCSFLWLPLCPVWS